MGEKQQAGDNGDDDDGYKYPSHNESGSKPCRGSRRSVSSTLNGRKAAILNHLHRRQETVPTAGNCLNENGSICGVSQYFTQTLDGCVQAGIEIDKSVRRPKRRMKIFARHNRSGALQQLSENQERLILKMQLSAASSEFTRMGIQFKVAETIARQSWRRDGV